MLTISAAARERLVEICGEELGRLVSDRIVVEIEERPLLEITPAGVRVGVWIRVSGPLEEVAAAAGYVVDVREWQGEPVDAARFEDAPCYICGAGGGPGYFNAVAHPCAAGYHLAVEKLGRVDQA